jgi:kynurenine 3-monooxygenase
MHLINKKISIVGAGLVGSLLSIYLRRQGAKVSIFDKRDDIRFDNNGAGRSINLALSNRGIRALNHLGIASQIMKIAMPMYRRVMHAENGDLSEQEYGKKDQAIYSVSRKDLNIKLIELAENEGVNILFENSCVGVNIDETKLQFDQHKSIDSDFIFGADGAGSVIRKNIAKSYPEIDMQEDFINHGYKELTIPANTDGTHKLASDALHIWPRKSFMVIALPNLDGTFTCTLFAPLKDENSFSSLNNKLDINLFFNKHFNNLTTLIPNLAEQYINNPLGVLGFVRCSTWKKKNIILLGDSCHATVPFYGQGMNSGFEDCFLFNEFIDKNQGINHNIYKFLSERIIDTRAMQDLSMNNYIEMRDKTASPHFLLKKKIEKWFSEKHLNKWIPLYSMVTFSHIPYSSALKKGLIQDDIMEKVMKKNKLTPPFSKEELISKNIESQILKLI